jgi:AraC family L-rhamnose operon regulatory protein RhaS
MKPHVFSQPEPIKISVFEAAAWRFPPHRHTHYELIYILKGHGQHTINDYRYPYQAGDLFLFDTRDVHWFDLAEPTRFCVIKMNPGFLEEANATFAELQPLFETDRFFEQPVFDADTTAYVAQQVHFCMREYAQQHAFYDSAIRASILSVLLLLRRAHTRQQVPPPALADQAHHLAVALVAYVHQQLKSPAQLSAAALGKQFHLNPRYLGQYFKRHLGRGLKRFVDENRVHALQQELRFSDKTVSQLASEYGFTDESHLTKTFKAVTRQTPLHYRAAGRTPTS